MAANFKAPIKAMDEKQKEWFATAMVSMVLADGDVAPSEVESLTSSISFIESNEAAERLKKYLHHMTMPNLTAFSGWANKPKAKALLMIDLLEVAIADRDLAPKEQEQFERIGKLLGFDHFQVQRFLNMGTQAMQHMDG